MDQTRGFYGLLCGLDLSKHYYNSMAQTAWLVDSLGDSVCSLPGLLYGPGPSLPVS